MANKNKGQQIEDIDKFNQFMIERWAFIKTESWQVTINMAYPYSLEPLYDEYRKKFK